MEGADHTRQTGLDADVPLDEIQAALWARVDQLYAQAIQASESSRALQAQAALQAHRSRVLFREARQTVADIRQRRDARRT